MATFYETVMARRTIRRFKQDPISRDDLVALVKAGSYAPSAGNGQSWQFIVVSFDHDVVRELLAVPEKWTLVSVLALGYPDEEPVVEETAEPPRARRGDDGVLTVQKRALESILHHNRFGEGA